MSEFLKINKFPGELSQENILRAIHCQPDSPVYTEVTECYEQLLPRFLQAVDPLCGVLLMPASEFSGPSTISLSGQIAVVLMTIGREASALSNQLFSEGEYLAGMLADAMGDAYLMHMDTVVLEQLRERCGKLGRRLQAPGGAPMELQDSIYRVFADKLPISITSGLMFDPAKSMGYALEVSEDIVAGVSQQDPASIKVTVYTGEESHTFSANGKEPLLALLQKEGFPLLAPCGGKGICGKCGLRFLQGAPLAGEADKSFFSEEELKAGWRLACCCYLTKDCTVLLTQADEGFQVLTGFGQAEGETTSTPVEGRERIIAIDIGTTTLAFALADKASGKVLATHAAVNPQRTYGADVISRIEASIRGEGEALKKLICQALAQGIRTLLAQYPAAADVVQVGIAGNTAMIHLLLGYPCDTLGVAPFTPVSLDKVEMGIEEMLGEPCGLQPQTTAVVLPGISAFVGGDISAGLLFAGFDQLEAPAFFLDLGTNGEIAFWTGKEILTTSTAAGPAFEGGRISCGTGSVPGAICGVEVEGNQFKLRTIGDEPPAGICGTGVVELVWGLLQTGYLDETGYLEGPDEEDFFPLAKDPQGGELSFTQQDVRELQLAKSAIRAGAETLLRKSGLSPEAVDRAWLAGGFDHKLDPEKAIGIGLLSEALSGRTQAPGNTSLGGVLHYLCQDDAPERLEKILALCREVPLAADPDFNELYMEHMLFETLE